MDTSGAPLTAMVPQLNGGESAGRSDSGARIWPRRRLASGKAQVAHCMSPSPNWKHHRSGQVVQTPIRMVLALCAQLSSLRVSAKVRRVCVMHHATMSGQPAAAGGLARHHTGAPPVRRPAALAARALWPGRVQPPSVYTQGAGRGPTCSPPPPCHSRRRPGPLWPRPRPWAPRPTASQQPRAPSWRSSSSSSSSRPPSRSASSAPTAPAA